MHGFHDTADSFDHAQVRSRVVYLPLTFARHIRSCVFPQAVTANSQRIMHIKITRDVVRDTSIRTVSEDMHIPQDDKGTALAAPTSPATAV